MLFQFFTIRLVPSGLVARYVGLLVLLGLAVTHWFHFWPGSHHMFSSRKGPFAVPASPPYDIKISYGGVKSPIRELMVNASAQFEDLIAQRTGDMWAASSRYRIRRGRHPPPGFEQWVDAAVESNSLIVEDFFDRIYKDLTPFWGLDPKVLRERAKAWHWVVRVRGGKTTVHGDVRHHPRWMQGWADMIREFSMHLPDVDMPINFADAPRLLVPFQAINKLVQEEASKRKLIPLAEVTDRYMSLADLDEQDITPYDPIWAPKEKNLWDVAVGTCSPESPASGVSQVSDLTVNNDIPKDWAPEFAYQGFAQNWTAGRDPCQQPHVRHMHRIFTTEPVEEPATEELIPLFSGSKLSMNNDIIIPGAMYLTDHDGGAQTKGPWSGKRGKVFWKGDEERLSKILDSDLVSGLEADSEEDSTIHLPSQDLYPSERRKKRQLGSWLASVVDAPSSEDTTTPANFEFTRRFLPDVDGATLTTRFRTLLRSTSLPLKSTLFTEWHDDRLIPWMHFVPLDATLQDLHAVLEFFADEVGPGDAAARFIAERGAEWTDKVLRREDMKLYLWRLLLEWARVVDENRETLGFTNDVMEHPD